MNGKIFTSKIGMQRSILYYAYFRLKYKIKEIYTLYMLRASVKY